MIKLVISGLAGVVVGVVYHAYLQPKLEAAYAAVKAAVAKRLGK